MNPIAKRRPVTLSRLLAPLKQFLTRLGVGTGHEIRLRSNYRLGDTKVRVSFDRAPIEITLGQDDKKLHLYPETRIDERGKPNRTGNFVIVDPAAQPGRINGFLRLTPKSWISLGPAIASSKPSSITPMRLTRSTWSSFTGRNRWSFAISATPARPSVGLPAMRAARVKAATVACARFSGGRSSSCRQTRRWR
ncbi:MAG: hypothetical protein IPN75_03990 [Dechloromonas sp.]|uniref:Uncharacterized protein n=1 Tax=Candidatus Dechloromonas phosphorivorans TaxID=2899244 RepID=A0A9D7LKN9_9RHOO|nr:hypothetical protein [Candidatus Dechloromonas phosphorivorans]